MAKKFDVVIGNPPYQEDASGTATHSMPIYHRFMDAAYEVGTKVVLITPARFLFDAGYTPKDWNAKMLADRHLSVAHFAPNSDELFPGTIINGGIVVTYRDADLEVEPIGTFTHFPELNTITKKVRSKGFEPLESIGITSSRSFRFTPKMHEDFPQASTLMAAGEQFKINTKTFDQLAFLYSEQRPQDGQIYVRVMGLDGKQRTSRWILGEYVSGPANLGKFKVVLPASRGHLGTLGAEPAIVIGTPFLGEPGVAVTQTYITIGAFDSEPEGGSCLKYVKSKFARALIGIIKATQHNPAKVWKYVPAQDFSSASDIDWSKSIPEIDAQLYAKYGLDDAEITFIESHVKSME
ncbi:restriction endonuclease Eco57I [Microbacterium testaceum]|uniref:Restriction endonuclease Eco57I n=1 Tax=Microbacterium testaceum TaxID=2033 RepID=A0A147F0P3_MICTE|nr:Eco57I restriction-modification methylase domain-containing protein [Microbacterium testaceum]KTR96386.1 restriction endonuclease Eco57I [Microbacterium testaceum]